MFTAPWSQDEVKRFLDGYFYSPDVFYITDVVEADASRGMLQARVAENASWKVTPYQRGSEDYHPQHISGPDLLMLTASLGALHAFFFHDCKWDEGWVGFGNRIDLGEFKAL